MASGTFLDAQAAEHVICAVAILIGTVWIYRAILFLYFHATWSYIYNAFDTRIDALMIGALVALMCSDNRCASLIGIPLKSSWLGALTLVTVAGSLGFDARINRHPVLQILNFTLQPAVIAVALVQVIHFGISKWSALDHWLLRFTAKISYSLYLFHALVLGEGTRLKLDGLSGKLFNIRILEAHQHPRLLLLVIPAIALSIISHYCIEQPFMRARDRKAERTPVQQITTSDPTILVGERCA